MSFRLTYFGNTAIPDTAFKQTGGPRARNAQVETVGGYHNADSGTARLVLPYNLTHSCLVYESAGIAALGATLQGLRAMLGKRDKLWMQPWDTTQDAQWAPARCIEVDIPATVYNRKTQPVTLTFSVETLWRGTAHGGTTVYASGAYLFGNELYHDATGATTLTTSPQTVVVSNGGDYRCDDCGITVYATDTAITYLKIGITDVSEIEFTTTINAGQYLYLDSGAQFARANGIDAYEGVHRTPNHTLMPYLRLESGANSVMVTKTGGSTNSTIQFTYSDTWA